MPDSVTHGWAGAVNASASFQRVNGVEARRNLSNRPNAISNWTGWAGSGGTLTYTYLAGSGLQPVGTFVRLTQTKDATAALVGPGVSFTAPIEAGKTYTLSFYGRSSRAGTSSLRARFSGGGAEVVGEFAAHAVDTWERRSLTLVAPSTGTVTLYLWWNVFAVTGDTFDGTGVLVEEGQSLRPYFDGSTPTDAYGSVDQAGLGRLDLDGYPELNGSTSALGEGLSGVVGVPEFLAAVYRESEGVLRLAGKEPRRLSLRVPSFRTEMSA